MLLGLRSEMVGFRIQHVVALGVMHADPSFFNMERYNVVIHMDSSFFIWEKFLAIALKPVEFLAPFKKKVTLADSSRK